MYIHDAIKIKYSEQGYLKGFPYHLISDKEMLDAFISDVSTDVTYFSVNYPCPEGMEEEYNILKQSILDEKDKFLSGNSTKLPDWVYSYMIGEVINNHSPEKDRHDYLVLLGLDNKEDIIGPLIYQRAYTISCDWVRKYILSDSRVPTMFGEPHIIKSMRLQQY